MTVGQFEYLPSDNCVFLTQHFNKIVCIADKWMVHSDKWRPRQNDRQFVDDSFRYIFLNENAWMKNKISLKSVPKGPINNIPALVLVMA